MFIASGVAVSKGAAETGSKVHSQHTARRKDGKSKSRLLLGMGMSLSSPVFVGVRAFEGDWSELSGLSIIEVLLAF